MILSLLLVLLLTSSSYREAIAQLTVRPSLQFAGGFDVFLDGELWLPAGQSVQVHHHGDWYTADTINNTKVLRPTVSVQERGRDALGTFQSRAQTWDAGGKKFQTKVRVYRNAVLFTQIFEDEFDGTAVGDRNKAVSAFPSLKVASFLGQRRRRGYLQYDGDMIGSEFHLGEWNNQTQKVGSGITGTAPLCIFAEDLKASMVLSPFSNFMAANQVFSDNVLSYGVMGNVASIPAGFELSTLISVSRDGPNQAMSEWGDKLLHFYGKGRKNAWQRDFALQYLGYSTDNGAYYYYNTEKGKNYQQTILDVHAYADQESLPYRYWLADSWWYFKGPNNGVKNWTELPSVFPNGLGFVQEKTRWLVQGHNRYWSNNTDYATRNGGEYEFLFDETTGYALPVEQRFWDFLMESSKRKWGLTTYEQDWLNREFDQFGPLTTNATLGSTWLHQMGAAAERLGLSIQHCMSHSRHMLASVEIPSVTQARASGDYHPGGDQWRPIGTTAMFAYAVGVAPSKDNYWSTSIQPGNRWGDNTTEPYNPLQAAVITLSKGPVCPGDAVGKSNRELIMRSAAEDGTLLQPDRPATQIDSALLNAALQTKGTPSGQVWFADSVVSGRRFGVLFAAELAAAYNITFGELGFIGGHGFVAVESNSSATRSAMQVVIGPHISLEACKKWDFQLYNIAPTEANGWTLLGEVKEKWVGVSPARFLNIEATDMSLSVLVRGTEGETVTVTFVDPNGKAVDVPGRVGADGKAKLSVPTPSTPLQSNDSKLSQSMSV